MLEDTIRKAKIDSMYNNVESTEELCKKLRCRLKTIHTKMSRKLEKFELTISNIQVQISECRRMIDEIK